MSSTWMCDQCGVLSPPRRQDRPDGPRGHDDLYRDAEGAVHSRKFEKQLGITIEPKAMFEGRLVDPAQDRSAATMRSRREAARPSGAAPTRSGSAGARDAAAPAGAVRSKRRGA